MADIAIRPADPASPEVAALIALHIARTRADFAAEAVHVLDVAALSAPGVRLFAATEGGEAAAIAALRDLGGGEVEVKSMFTRDESRGKGIAARLLARLVDEARGVGARRILLETGTDPGSVPARRLYASAGFRPCGAYGDYPEHPESAFMVLDLAPD
ncbi:GNAT family N-acetyltransferase [Rhodobacterales bacterium HKCCE2091]|nr:GNAT family N-acetyltransferase [Rhodobacterales bacterium HKCCE2091]